MTSLPIDDVLPQISSVLASGNRLVLSAPPGAGKTTKVPLHLLEAGWLDGQKIIMLEPRRIAARRAAEFMARQLGESVGDTIGVRSRLDTRIGPNTRIEVVTEGVFTNLITRDPDLPGIGAVLFDEFHERSLDADLGLALALETQSVLNEALRIVVMSATLDVERVKTLLHAPVVQSDGRAYPVETKYSGRTQDRLEDQMARAVRTALSQETGSVLAFLPGAAEINRTAERLSDLPDDILVCPLYGALSPNQQDDAIRPAPDGLRKVVLATDIAESSLTIEGVRVVVDSGLARIPQHTPGSLGASLRTVKASLANVDQRRGRAGRTEPGVCYRLWHEEENRGLPASPPPEILNTDLAAMLLRLAQWGNADPSALTWLDPPSMGMIESARQTLISLGFLTGAGQLTPDGQTAARLPVSPKLARLILAAETDAERALAAQLAALLSEHGAGGQSIDLTQRVRLFAGDTSQRAKALKARAKSWAGTNAPARGDVASLLARAWPDQIARQREPGSDRFQLSSGGGVRLPENSPFARETWLMVCETSGASGKEAIIRLACALDGQTAMRNLPENTYDYAEYDPESAAVRARRQKRLGGIVVSETPLKKPTAEITADAIVRAAQTSGLGVFPGWSGLRTYLNRIAFARSQQGADWPDTTEAALLTCLDDWLTPAILSSGLAAIESGGLTQALKHWLQWGVTHEIDRLAPTHWTSPSGRQVRIEYDAEQAPMISIRVQELYGLTRHPTICDGKIPLTLSLLSPAQRQVALTKDLPGFWRGGYSDMRKDMKGRYPKHSWPEDPASARPPEPRPPR